MAATQPFTVRIDKQVKKESEALFDALGISLGTAINIFLRKAIQYGGLPFEVALERPNAATLAALEESVRLTKDPSVKGYTNVEEALAELKK